jgi:hypothetical protein
MDNLDDLEVDDLVPEDYRSRAAGLHVRLPPALVRALDGWIGKHGPPFVGRQEAIKRLVVQGLKAEGK